MISPSVGESSLAKSFKNVDLPLPDSPHIATTPVSFSSKFTSLTPSVALSLST